MSFRIIDTWEIPDLYEPDAFYTHGDNPALKRFMSIAQQNNQDGVVMDHRTLIIDRARRFLLWFMVGLRMQETGMTSSREMSRRWHSLVPSVSSQQQLCFSYRQRQFWLGWCPLGGSESVASNKQASIITLGLPLLLWPSLAGVLVSNTNYLSWLHRVEDIQVHPPQVRQARDPRGEKLDTGIVQRTIVWRILLLWCSTVVRWVVPRCCPYGGGFRKKKTKNI